MAGEFAKNLEIILDFVERWNKMDKEVDVAEAASYFEEHLKRLRAGAEVANSKRTPEERSKSAKKVWRKRKIK